MDLANDVHNSAPWFYRSPYKERLKPAAHALRNLTLIFGYYTGMFWVAILPLVFILRFTAPTVAVPLWEQFGPAPRGAVVGLILGALFAVYYLWRYPHNKRGGWVLLLVATGLGGLVGLGLLFLGGIGGEAALLFCALGLSGYWYMENYPSDEHKAEE